MNDVFEALANPTRREILSLLREKEMMAGEIAKCVPVSKPTLSAHLAKLKAAGLVSTIRDRQRIIYSLNTSVLEDVLIAFLGHFEKEKGKGNV